MFCNRWLGALVGAMGLWSLAPVQAAPHAGAAFWLVTFYSSTAPAEELDLEALQLEQGPDRGGFAEKVSLIEKARASGVAETESMVVQQLPMPSLAACERAGQEIAQAFTLPSQMTITRYVCVRGR